MPVIKIPDCHLIVFNFHIPAINPPPCIQNITGSLASGSRMGVKTFRTRQSSLISPGARSCTFRTFWLIRYCSTCRGQMLPGEDKCLGGDPEQEVVYSSETQSALLLTITYCEYLFIYLFNYLFIYLFIYLF